MCVISHQFRLRNLPPPAPEDDIPRGGANNTVAKSVSLSGDLVYVHPLPEMDPIRGCINPAAAEPVSPSLGTLPHRSHFLRTYPRARLRLPGRYVFLFRPGVPQLLDFALPNLSVTKTRALLMLRPR